MMVADRSRCSLCRPVVQSSRGGIPVSRSFGRSLGRFFARQPAQANRHFGNFFLKRKTTQKQLRHSHDVTRHSLPPRVPPFQLASRSQPLSEAPQSASVSSQSNPAVLPIRTSPTPIPSPLSLPPFPAPVAPPTADPDSAQTRCRSLGSVESSFAELSQTIAAADSWARSSPRLACQCSPAHPLVSPHPQSLAGIAAPAGSPEPSSLLGDPAEA